MSAFTDKIVTVQVAAFMALNVLMLLLDERLPWLFPYIFGIDIRYLIAIALPVVNGLFFGVRALVRRVVK